MFEYSVIFTNNSGKFGVLLRFATNEQDAIKTAIESLPDHYTFYSVEAVRNISI